MEVSKGIEARLTTTTLVGRMRDAVVSAKSRDQLHRLWCCGRGTSELSPCVFPRRVLRVQMIGAVRQLVA